MPSHTQKRGATDDSSGNTTTTNTTNENENNNNNNNNNSNSNDYCANVYVQSAPSFTERVVFLCVHFCWHLTFYVLPRLFFRAYSSLAKKVRSMPNTKNNDTHDIRNSNQRSGDNNNKNTIKHNSSSNCERGVQSMHSDFLMDPQKNKRLIQLYCLCDSPDVGELQEESYDNNNNNNNNNNSNVALSALQVFGFPPEVNLMHRHVVKETDNKQPKEVESHSNNSNISSNNDEKTSHITSTITPETYRRYIHYAAPLYDAHTSTILGAFKPFPFLRYERRTIRSFDGCRICLDFIHPARTGDSPRNKNSRNIHNHCSRSSSDDTSRASEGPTTHRHCRRRRRGLVLLLPGLMGSSAELYMRRMIYHIMNTLNASSPAAYDDKDANNSDSNNNNKNKNSNNGNNNSNHNKNNNKKNIDNNNNNNSNSNSMDDNDYDAGSEEGRILYSCCVLHARGVCSTPLDVPQMFSALFTSDLRFVLSEYLTQERLHEILCGCGGEEEGEEGEGEKEEANGSAGVDNHTTANNTNNSNNNNNSNSTDNTATTTNNSNNNKEYTSVKAEAADDQCKKGASCCPRIPVVAVAFSLGGLILSNYIGQQGRQMLDWAAMYRRFRAEGCYSDFTTAAAANNNNNSTSKSSTDARNGVSSGDDNKNTNTTEGGNININNKNSNSNSRNKKPNYITTPLSDMTPESVAAALSVGFDNYHNTYLAAAITVTSPHCLLTGDYAMNEIPLTRTLYKSSFSGSLMAYYRRHKEMLRRLPGIDAQRLFAPVLDKNGRPIMVEKKSYDLFGNEIDSEEEAEEGEGEMEEMEEGENAEANKSASGNNNNNSGTTVKNTTSEKDTAHNNNNNNKKKNKKMVPLTLIDTFDTVREFDDNVTAPHFGFRTFRSDMPAAALLPCEGKNDAYAASIHTSTSTVISSASVGKDADSDGSAGASDKGSATGVYYSSSSSSSFPITAATSYYASDSASYRQSIQPATTTGVFCNDILIVGKRFGGGDLVEEEMMGSTTLHKKTDADTMTHAMNDSKKQSYSGAHRATEKTKTTEKTSEASSVQQAATHLSAAAVSLPAVPGTGNVAKSYYSGADNFSRLPYALIPSLHIMAANDPVAGPPPSVARTWLPVMRRGAAARAAIQRLHSEFCREFTETTHTRNVNKRSPARETPAVPAVPAVPTTAAGRLHLQRGSGGAVFACFPSGGHLGFVQSPAAVFSGRPNDMEEMVMRAVQGAVSHAHACAGV